MAMTLHLDHAVTARTERPRFASTMIARIAEWWRMRNAERLLGTFSDAMLKDIGVSRSEIGRAVRDGVPGRRDDPLAAFRRFPGAF